MNHFTYVVSYVSLKLTAKQKSRVDAHKKRKRRRRKKGKESTAARKIADLQM